MSSRREISMQNLPRAGRWAIYIALAVTFAIACAFLSMWQFTRNEDRSAQLALVEANYDEPAVTLGELIPDGGELNPEDQWRQVRLVGEYVAADQLLVRNRPHGGTSAFEVLVPFRLEDGRVLLIDRGWVPPGEDGPNPETVPAPPSGDVTVIARLKPGEQVPASGRSAPEGQVPTINLPLIADGVSPETGEALERSAYGVLVSEDPAPSSLPSPLESPSEDPGPHLSYAIQWILFAAMGFIFIGYVIRTERAHRRDEQATASDEAADDAAGPPKAAPSRRTRDRDADDEDALLDAAEPNPVRRG